MAIGPHAVVSNQTGHFTSCGRSLDPIDHERRSLEGDIQNYSELIRLDVFSAAATEIQGLEPLVQRHMA